MGRRTDPPSLEASAGETRHTRSAVVSTEAGGDWDLRHETSREHRLPLWRRLLTIALAAVFTVVMMSLGLIRHKDDHFDGPLLSPPLPSTVRNGAPP
ncbi:MAG: hypothetical protein KGO48_11390 [Alphaproteobacteria bacterium]|nr:hypothetical protein [Alphaproteobacteria bacterium]